jgi:hypothetical protein
MEEKFVFPIGRKTWHILAFLALLGLALFIVWFVVNLTPTSRENVQVSRTEVMNNQVDTTAVVRAEAAPSGCDPQVLKNYTDSIRRDLPMAEWTNLGEYGNPYDEYQTDEYSNYITDVDGNYVVVEKKPFYPNPEAVPNILENLFKSRAIDSTMVCERIELLGLLHQLNLYTESGYLYEEAFSTYVKILKENREIYLGLVQKAAGLKSRIEAAESSVENREDLKRFAAYIDYLARNTVTDDQIEICMSLLDDHRKINDPEYDRAKYFELAQLIFESGIPSRDLEAAVDDFKDDLEYYDKNNLYKSLKRYLKLYQEKVSIAELTRAGREQEKAANRSFSLLAIGVCFASIISIATILLLYSIQRLLKNHVSSKEAQS